MEGGGPPCPWAPGWDVGPPGVHGGVSPGGSPTVGSAGGWHPIPPGYPGHPGWAPYPLPPHPALPFLPSTGSRVAAYLIDLVVILLMTIPVYLLMLGLPFGLVLSDATLLAPFVLFVPLALLPIVIQLGYVALSEGRTGQMIGKWAVGIRVVNVDGRPATWHDAVVRWICLVVDHQPTLGILGLVLVSTPPLKQRVGGLAAGTIVARAPRLTVPSSGRAPAGRLR